MTMGYIASKPLVITKREDGSDLYLYHGSPVPGHVKGEELQRLLDGEFIAEDDATEAPADVPPAMEEKPAGNASLKAWQSYAKSQGTSEEDLDGLSRDDVRSLFS